MNKAEYDFSLRLYKNKTIEINELHYFVVFSVVDIILSACAFATYSGSTMRGHKGLAL